MSLVHKSLCSLCSIDKPMKKEKMKMSQSIVSRFPSLKADGGMVYVSLKWNMTVLYNKLLVRF